MSLDRAFEVLRSAVANVPLRDVQQSRFGVSVDGPSLEIGDNGGTLSATNDLALSVLNEARDEDDDKVFATSGSDDVPAHIPFDAQNAWLKYRFTGTLKAGASATSGLLEGAIEAQRQISILDYRRHDATENAWSAIAEDCRSPRTILDIDAVRNLKTGEALALQIDGKLSTTVTFSWADTLSTSLSELTRFLPPGEDITVKMGPEATVTAEVTVEDDFVVVMSRNRENRLRIAVKKATSRGRSVNVTAQIGAGIDVDAPIVSAVMDALGRFDRAGIDDVVDALRKIAKAKAEAGFAYEYARIDEETAIADYLLATDAQLEHDHRPAITGDLATLVQRLAHQPDGRTLIQYLNETSLTRTESLGFSLGIGRWAVKATDESTLTYSVRRNLAKEQMIACKGARSYDETRLRDNDFTWTVDLKADMDHYAAAPVTTELDYGLAYLVTFSRRSLDVDDVRRFVDFASMWNIASDAASALEDAIGRETTVRFQLLWKHEALAATLAQVPKTEVAGWARAIAAAVPYLRDFHARRTHTLRAQAYAQACALWLTEPRYVSEATWKATLRRHVDGDLLQYDATHLAASFVRLVTEDCTELRPRHARFVEGARLLSRLMSTPQKPEEIRRAYELLRSLWSQRPYITASGVYLLARAERAGVLAQVERTMTVTSGAGAVVAGRAVG